MKTWLRIVWPLTWDCQAASCGPHATWERVVPRSAAITLPGARPSPRTSTIGDEWRELLQNTTAQVSAWSLHSDMDECHVCATYERSRGHCVRAVRTYQ